MPSVPPPAVALGAALAQRVLTRGRPAPGRGRAVVAAACALASTAMTASAVRSFVSSGTTLEPHHPERASVLVTSGAHAISRNPMYVGLAGLLVAHAVWRGSWAGLGPVAGFVAFIDRVQIRAEEEALITTFGSDYADYRTDTPRWLGPRSFGPSAAPRHRS